ncbi:Vitamin K epoxide reductase [hydrothermal vent metagenome]|uniref:Vitamin K epoxide reductase n=1 Tax=hydrothermal vent metagenome TaxID=652676 RepID=A0A1W1BP81_9ZZZZ
MKKLSFVYLPILFFIYLAVEAVLKLNHSTLCESTGCLLADNLLWFDSIYLNFMGLADALIILALGWLSYKKAISEKLFFLVLFASLGFETILLTYQYFASPEMCKFCMGVYTFLVVIMLLSSKKYFLMVVPVIVSVIVALSFLTIPKSEAFVTKDGNYLIQSATCKHCKKVKKYLHENNISFTKLNIDDIEARNFATFLNFKTIPILIVKEGKQIHIINGDNNIIDSFSKPKETVTVEDSIVAEESVVVESSSSSDLLYNDNAGADEGCGFASITTLEEESNCSK